MLTAVLCWFVPSAHLTRAQQSPRVGVTELGSYTWKGKRV